MNEPMSENQHDFRARFDHWIEHLEHVLPGQASIRDFVHHNTLHGYAHLPFHEALAAARRELGIAGYWSAERFRAEHAAGRIADADINAVLDTVPDIDAVLAGAITRRQLWNAALRQDCGPLSVARLCWELDEGRDHRSDAGAALWVTCVELALGDVTELAMAEERFSVSGATSLRELIRQLGGEDILDAVRGELVRHLASHLDLGIAPWHNPARGEGFYAAWRRLSARDPAWVLGSQNEAQAEIAELPADPAEFIEAELRRIGFAETQWQAVLRRLALDLPGWSGMFLWRSQRPGYGHTEDVPVHIADYLAVRLLVERLAADAVARRLWGVPARLAELAAYFDQHPVELRLRLACHRGELPESLASRVQQMEAPGERPEESRAAWAELAHEAAASLDHELLRKARVAWPLYRLARQLGMDAAALHALGRDGIAALHAALAELDADRMGAVWLGAYERHYAEQVFTALAANHGRTTVSTSTSAQLVLCMDDREEGFRRHLEETDPRLETLGGAAHFGVFQNFYGVDDSEPTALCPVVPVVVRPAHAVHETLRDETELPSRQRRLFQRSRYRRIENEATRLAPLAGTLTSLLLAPKALAALLLRSFAPAILRDVPPPPATRLDLTAAENTPATPDSPRRGFTDDEQAERIFNFLANLGLTKNFAPLVAIIGHGSWSQNNPHLAAYDCGACAGRHSGANARLFAAMANRPEVRARLAARGIDIPTATWFLSAEHNTADDGMQWYDTEDIPPALATAFVTLAATARQAGARHAVERCRRLMSAPLDAPPEQAWRHVAGRRRDFAQPRPELGHVTNAAAFVGRRSMSRGAYFDRRAFLISYDPFNDEDGRILERLLLANGPVGAGISLEYYFSSVDNERFGCGTKTMHNIVGGLGVYAGGGGDLRTGLPWQMIEIHEPMRLLIVIEQTLESITAIYQRQPPLQELVGKGWVLLAAKDPVSGAIHRFDPARGWLSWQGEATLPTATDSLAWIAGRRDPLPPALLSRPLEAA